jgi:hypothetical protein
MRDNRHAGHIGTKDKCVTDHAQRTRRPYSRNRSWQPSIHLSLHANKQVAWSSFSSARNWTFGLFVDEFPMALSDLTSKRVSSCGLSMGVQFLVVTSNITDVSGHRRSSQR